MLKRKAMQTLKSWKQRPRLSLIIDGARQVGKTFIVRAFAREEYASFFELNFLENPDLKKIFSGSLQADQLLMLIRTYFPAVAFADGNTLIFFDEVQECPEAITALKFLSKDPRFDVIATGSALGMAYRQVTSYPVGHVEYFDMHALDFTEFLWAYGIESDVIESLREHFLHRVKVHDALHERILRVLTEYLILGGMPEVVQTFVDSGDYLVADAVQRRLHRDYLADIALYAEAGIKIKAESCYKSIPQQLSKENHKFQYGVVERKGTARKFESSIDWLEQAHLVTVVNNVSTPAYPLNHFVKDNNFRLYPTDIGMLMTMYDVNVKSALLMEKELGAAPQHPLLQTAKGGLFESLAADFLYKNGHGRLFFFRNDSGTVEVEFLLEGPEGVVPIEIKAGRAKTTSLDKLLEAADIPYGYKFASQNVGVSGKKVTLPLYMMMFL